MTLLSGEDQREGDSPWHDNFAVTKTILRDKLSVRYKPPLTKMKQTERNETDGTIIICSNNGRVHNLAEV